MTGPDLRWHVTPADIPSQMVEAIVSCWSQVSNAGGAVGFPFPPVNEHDVREAVVKMRASLGPDFRLLSATVAEGLAGWLVLRLNSSPLTRHWGLVARVQTDLPYRGTGIGASLMQEVARAAATEGLEQLHIEVRGGQGLEDFYARLGWTEVGRWPRALRLGLQDDRDEVLMVMHLDR